MMFMVLFSSLGVAMAISARGNLRTASTSLHVQKALAAAETGLTVGQQRLIDAASRFVISPGKIDRDTGKALWDGTLSSSLYLSPLPPSRFGQSETGQPAGVWQALYSTHSADGNLAQGASTVTAPTRKARPSGAPSEFRDDWWLVTAPVAVDQSVSVTGAAPSAYQLQYVPFDDGVTVRVYSTGYSSVSSGGSSYMFSVDSTGKGQAVTRTIYQDFKLVKRQKNAIVGPSKIMVGKNVNVTGDIGAVYGGDDANSLRVDKELNFNKGDPLVVKSDFFGIDTVLDRKLRDFYTGVAAQDQDGDFRLRPSHPKERLGFPSPIPNYEAGQEEKNGRSFDDATRDGFVDDFDLFLNHFDTNNDGYVALWDSVREDTAYENASKEFDLDKDLALLIDRANPDRNKNGIFGFQDVNGNGVYDSGEPLLDLEDQKLGWMDGVLDYRDKYAKIRGRAIFRATDARITAGRTVRSNNGEVLTPALQGPIVANGKSAQKYGAKDSDLPPLSEESFTTAASNMMSKAEPNTDGAGNLQPKSFAKQVELARSLPTGTITAVNGATSAFVETRASGTGQARYFPSNMNASAVKALTGANPWEPMPIGTPSFSDWYIRPRYENMTFTNVTIPRGNNGLFVNCTFVGITAIDTDPVNTHQLWQEYGRLQGDGTNQPQPVNVEDKSLYDQLPAVSRPSNYSSLLDPPLKPDGSWMRGAERDTKPRSNNIRFHNCTFYGSIAARKPNQFTQMRNKVQFTGATKFSNKHPTDANLSPRPEDQDLVDRSSLMAPQFSVDIGQYNAPSATHPDISNAQEQNVQLQGTIIAGVIDVRGNTTIDGSLIATYDPEYGQGQMSQYGQPVGNPANYNITLGYFATADGDLDTTDMNNLPDMSTRPGMKRAGWDIDGDGLIDFGPNANPDITKYPGRQEIPFYGYGKIRLTWNPDLPMPDGIYLPVSVVTVGNSYGEGGATW